MTEPEMIARVLAGERNLFHELIRPYEKLVYLTAFSILKDETEAEETAQEAVISAYRHLASFRAECEIQHLAGHHRGQRRAATAPHCKARRDGIHR